MKCIVPGVNLKVFGRAIHSLAKIGDELYFEPLEQGLSLRTVNSSRSAYACFLFFPSYFQHYDDGTRQTEAGDNEEEGLRCKIAMKSMMAVFRSLSTIEKTVEKCRISHNAREARVIFELHCRHGIVKTHNLAYIECETLQAIFSKDLCPNKLTAPSKLLCEVVVNFQTTQEEITLTVRPDSLTLKNYVEDEPDPSKVVHTELSLAPEEFDQYQIGVDTDITFCLKELRAILAFGETTGLPINISFESAGRPVTFCIDSDKTFEANFVLATLADSEQSSSQMSQSQRPQQTASQHHTKPSMTGKQVISRNASAKASTSKNIHTERGSSNAEKRNNNQEYIRNRPQPLPGAAAAVEDPSNSMADISAEELAAAMEAEREWEQEEKDSHSQSRARSPDGSEQDSSQNAEGQGRGRSGGEREEWGRQEAGCEDSCVEMGLSSPVIAVQCPSTGKQKREGPCLQPLEDEEEEDDLDDTIPGTPPAKKLRSLFFGSSQKGSQSTQQRQNTTVLAEDTDEED